MAKTKNTSAISASALKTTNKTKTSEIVRNAVPYVEQSKDSATYFCWTEPFAFHILGATMLPNFNVGDTVIIDPYRKPKDGDFVVAGLPGQSLVFRKYACTLGAPYQLLATNPQYAPLDPVLPVVGVMTSHHSKVDDHKEVEHAILSLISSARSSVEDGVTGTKIRSYPPRHKLILISPWLLSARPKTI
ncbi:MULTISPECIES: S24 family peptidase [Acidobacteriaceae]|uniref:S24 family peptidase n=1 Tax=Acidobacteriaceae TaxID=204434 RepID=UPI00131DDC78|nr:MULTISPECIES: S24 family peptidase [Acidobacteriaceae]MDW5266934.1 S24 family peptidase [Edaphobacter sp.]